jgi:hypothetical protein
LEQQLSWAEAQLELVSAIAKNSILQNMQGIAYERG